MGRFANLGQIVNSTATVVVSGFLDWALRLWVCVESSQSHHLYAEWHINSWEKRVHHFLDKRELFLHLVFSQNGVWCTRCCPSIWRKQSWTHPNGDLIDISFWICVDIIVTHRPMGHFIFPSALNPIPWKLRSTINCNFDTERELPIRNCAKCSDRCLNNGPYLVSLFSSVNS